MMRSDSCVIHKGYCVKIGRVPLLQHTLLPEFHLPPSPSFAFLTDSADESSPLPLWYPSSWPPTQRHIPCCWFGEVPLQHPTPHSHHVWHHALHTPHPSSVPSHYRSRRLCGSATWQSAQGQADTHWLMKAAVAPNPFLHIHKWRHAAIRNHSINTLISQLTRENLTCMLHNIPILHRFTLWWYAHAG